VDIEWLKPDGSEMSDEDWDAGFARSIGVVLDGGAIRTRDERGRPILDDSFLLLLNAHDEAIDWTLPEPGWELLLDTNQPTGEPAPDGDADDGAVDGDAATKPHRVPGRSVLVFRRPRDDG
jgi:glycogen operon protein